MLSNIYNVFVSLCDVEWYQYVQTYFVIIVKNIYTYNIMENSQQI